VTQAGTYIVAHRAANTLAELERAACEGVAMVEGDVHLFWGRLEVRHLKTIGPIPILWDRWFLANPFTPRVRLERVLRDSGADVHLMLDLKGARSAVGGAVRRALLARAPGRPITVCSRNWRALARLGVMPGVRIVYSVGSKRQLRTLLARFGRGTLEGVSVHADLLTPAIVGQLRDRAATVMSWPIDSPERADVLAGWGVQGFITAHPDVLEARAAS
jgi:glycerophosphoryl diester phosphodiesterase